MIDHVSLAVRDLAAAGAFYDAALAPLSLARLVVREGSIGYGRRYPEFWLNRRPDWRAPENPGAHVCLRAPDADAVRAFHEAALARGGRDAGAPGPRTATVKDYYGAFILDLDGNKVEAVTFPREGAG